MVIVGAGISGINAAYRLQSETPWVKYTILEGRDALGGTWDLFRYPGIRSDSDLYTFGLAWYPWTGNKGIVAGPEIRKYLTAAVQKYGIDKQIQYRHRVEHSNWSSKEQNWVLSVAADGEKKVIRSRWLLLCTGYYDYEEPLKAEIPGLSNFKGTTIHPQFWPEDLDYTDKKVAVIGSGATAITLLPSLTDKAARVTMVQRSPGYIISVPSRDRVGEWTRSIFPSWIASRLDRWRNFAVPQMLYYYCQVWPGSAKRLLQRLIQKQLPSSISVNPHFSPRYNPWEQRLCVSPGGDFFKALRQGKSDIVTGSIKTVTETSLVMEDGTEVPADIIITATGLKMRLAGGMRLTVDDQPVNMPEKFVWRGMMLEDVPNHVFVIGYTNASWTLGADATAHFLVRLLKYMKSKNLISVTPHLSAEEKKRVQTVPFMNLTSTYVEKSKSVLPKAGDRGPWVRRYNYLVDMWLAKYSGITDHLNLVKAGDRKVWVN